MMVFGLWRVRFPPVLVRTGRRLPVQALGERGVWVSVTGYPRGGARGGELSLGQFLHCDSHPAISQKVLGVLRQAVQHMKARE